MDCLFCKIAKGDIPSNLLHADDQVVAFNDINPQAPVHILIIPRKHLTTLNDLSGDDFGLVGRMTQVAQKLAIERQIDQKGYRLAVNCNREGGQTVFHVHMHLLGGRQLGGSLVG